MRAVQLRYNLAFPRHSLKLNIRVSFQPKEIPISTSDIYARFWPKVGIGIGIGIMEDRILSITALGRAGLGK